MTKLDELSARIAELEEEKRILELEAEVARLRAEVEALKAAPGPFIPYIQPLTIKPQPWTQQPAVPNVWPPQITWGDATTPQDMKYEVLCTT